MAVPTNTYQPTHDLSHGFNKAANLSCFIRNNL
jgi:hypothetical protein